MSSTRVAIQGIATSFHDFAAKKYFGSNAVSVECSSFKAVCECLKNGNSDFGVMAIENSITGSILGNYTLLSSYHFKIIGEVFLHIQMNLMAHPGVELKDIEVIQSHPVAIRQCGEFLETLPEKIKILEKSDTASSAKQIMDEKLKNTAAIAGAEVARVYGLDILEKRIEDNKKNYTRFLILSNEPNVDKTNNKASLCFELGHQVGALSIVLNILKEHSINMTKIQSLPIVGKPYEYSFHVDVEWSDYNMYEKAINLVLRNVSTLTVLGEYQKGEFDNSFKNGD